MQAFSTIKTYLTNLKSSFKPCFKQISYSNSYVGRQVETATTVLSADFQSVFPVALGETPLLLGRLNSRMALVRL